MLTFIDLFAGVGGFRRGMELAGHKCVGFCEWDKFATASYTSMHLINDSQRKHLATLDLKKRQKEILKDVYKNGEWYSNDIRHVSGSDIPKADCWCFGAPCQDFSVAGLRAGLDGGRSSLVREVFRILREIREEDRPQWLIYENVKGMLSSNKGFDFLTILLEMDELGYDIEWQLFNSKYYVPQNRERIYTVGHLRTRGKRKIFPIERTDGKDSIPIKLLAHRDGYRRNSQTFDPGGITEALSTCAGGGREHHTAIKVLGEVKREGRARASENLVVCQNHLSPSLVHSGGGGKQPNIAVPLIYKDKATIKVKEATKQGYAEAYEGDSINLAMPESKTRRGRVGKEVAQTLDTTCNQGVFVKLSDDLTVYAVWYENYNCYIAIRKLIPLECFRLQGWTDDYFERAEFVNSDSQLYKQAGNGVTVNVVYDIAKRLD